MNTRLLGATGLSVSRLGLGLAALGRPGYINLGHAADIGSDRAIATFEARAHSVLDAAWATGIRYFDAARSYGRAETFLASWLASRQIPPGQVRSYSWVAQTIGRPRAARAVGQVMARNPLPLLFPCHRVVDSSGDLHDYFYGLEMKAKLLQMEGYRG